MEQNLEAKNVNSRILEISSDLKQVSDYVPSIPNISILIGDL